MFFENKSESGLSEKSTVQHRVICDWLRNIDKKLTRINIDMKNLHKGFDLLLENESSPEDGNDNSASGSVS